MKKYTWLLLFSLVVNCGVVADDTHEGCDHEACQHDHVHEEAPKKQTWQELFQINPVFYRWLDQELKFALQAVTDYESKRLIQSILHDPSLLSDPETEEKVRVICERAKLIANLAQTKEEIKDEATRELVESWLKNELLLDDVQVKTQAIKIVHRIQYFNALLDLQNLVSDEKTKRLIQEWIAYQSKLDDLDVQERIRAIANRVELIKKLTLIQGRIKDEETIKQIKAWFSEPSLLDEMEAREKAKKVIKRIRLYKKLLALEIKIRDEATKKQVRIWLTDQTRLDDESVQKMVKVIKLRLDLFDLLHRAKEKIRDKKTRDKVAMWLSDTPQLDDPVVWDLADTIIKRVEMVGNLVSIQGKITDEDEKKLVDLWLANTTLLDDPSTYQQAEKIVNRMIAEQFKKLEKLVGRVKNGSLFAYMLYRKFMVLKAIDTGQMPGWFSWLFNTSMAIGYPLTEGLSYLLFKDIPSDPNLISNWAYVGNLIKSDDVAEKIYEQVTKKYNADRKLFLQHRGTNAAAWGRVRDAYGDMLLANDPTSDAGELMGRFLDGFRAQVVANGGTEQAWEGIKNQLREAFIAGGGAEQGWDDVVDYFKRFFVTHKRDSNGNLIPLGRSEGAEWHRVKDVIWELRKRQVALEIKRTGFPRKELNFFPAFDAKYDYSLIEKPVDKLLEKMNVPEGIRNVVWKNRIIRFARRMALFKVLPTYLYWKGKVLWGEYQNEQNRTAFSDYIPYKEAVKSIGLSFRLKLADFLVNKMNGKIDDNGLGALDRMHDSTLGVLGPNLISEATEFGVKSALIGISNELKPNFLTKADYFDANKSAQEIIVTRACNHVGKSVFATGLRKVFGFVRPLVFNKAAKKTRKFLKFLARRNWIDPMWSSDKAWQMLRIVPHFATAPVYFWTLGENPIISIYDYQRASMEAAKTGDAFKLLDYLLAGWIGGELAAWGTGKLIGRLKAGQVIS